MAGYIKDHRKELESDVWLMPPLYHRTWQWLKYNVNHADNEIPMRDGSRMLIKRGQRLTSIRDIAKGISWYEGRKYKEPNPKTVSAILDWMIKTNMIEITRGQGNREYTLITLVNYEVYNEKETQGNSKVTPDGEAREQSADINNNDKELSKNEKELKEVIPYKDIVEYLNFHAGTNYKHTTRTTKEHINARWREGFTLEQFKTVIDKKCAEWKDDPKMSQYLRPQTLFNSEKFESYLNQTIVLKGGQAHASKPEPRRQTPAAEYHGNDAAGTGRTGLQSAASGGGNAINSEFDLDKFVRR